MPELAEFHFLRPHWLWAAVLFLALYALNRWSEDPRRQWGIAPHLLEHLLVGRARRARFLPAHMIALLGVLASVALAGPSWRREATPFAEDKAPLVVALDLSTSMDAIDVPPTRLERAKQKISDLLELRAGARTGLIAYAGTAHMVLPLTDDRAILETYLAALETTLMPVQGKDAAAALARAEAMLGRDGTPGSILFLTDGIPEPQRPAFVAHARGSEDSLLVLGVGTSEGGPVRAADGGFVTDPSGRRLTAKLDRAGLEALSRETGAFVATATLDDRDVRRLQGRVQSHLESAQQQDVAGRWRDEGYALVVPVALLAALWFRRGWSVRWAGLVALATLAPAPAHAQDSGFLDLWLTPDQQGRRLFERGDFAEAAQRFRDPLWRGLACYRAEDWDCAIDGFAQRDTPEASFNLGNAYARSEQYELAVEAYDQALAQRPAWREARENRERVAALIPEEPEPEEESEPGDPSFDPDEIRFDEKGEKGKRGEVDQMGLSDEQMGEIWLRGLQTTPAGFLRYKFAFQAAGQEGGQR